MDDPNRRPIAARRLAPMQGLARQLTARGATPNGISQVSMVFAALGFAAFWAAPMAGVWGQGPLLLLAALMIQGRLVCNLVDGLVAVEGGRATPQGAFWNEAPDRVADTLLLWGAGLAAGHPALGLGCAVLAVGTAYLREFGRAEGFVPYFGGPMAKQHRMAALTLGAVVAAFWTAQAAVVLTVVLAVIALGTLVTAGLRARRVLGHLAGR